MLFFLHMTNYFVLLRVASYSGRSYYGPPEYQCQHYAAIFWFQERVKTGSSVPRQRVIYNLCCKGGKVAVPPFVRPPTFLADLVRYDGNRRTKKFLTQIRQYNCLFAFTSMGANIDRSLPTSRGPKYFKIQGQAHHRIGSLVPKNNDPPKYVELYIYAGDDEAKTRINALTHSDGVPANLDPAIVNGLITMLNDHNDLVKTFTMAKERLKRNPHEHVSIRILAPSEGDGPQFSLPTTNQLAALVVGEFTADKPSRDIVVDNMDLGLQQISSLHPAFMALQYPLLFTYAERGFQINVPYIGLNPASQSCRNKMTMQDYYCFVCHYRSNQSNPYLCYGLLSSQTVVDSRACIDENRIWYVLRNQDQLRAEHLQGLTDAVGQGFVDGADVGKMTILPSSHTGGRRYFVENFQDGLAVCRVHAAPDIFTTFTCNPKWPEITEALLLEPGQKPSDRADIIVRVYKMKLDEYIDDIKAGRAYGPIKAGTTSLLDFLPHFYMLAAYVHLMLT